MISHGEGGEDGKKQMGGRGRDGKRGEGGKELTKSPIEGRKEGEKKGGRENGRERRLGFSPPSPDPCSLGSREIDGEKSPPTRARPLIG